VRFLILLFLVLACAPTAPTAERSKPESARQTPTQVSPTAERQASTGEARAMQSQRLAGGLKTELVADGLQLPANLAFAPDGRLFLTEVSLGQVRVIERGRLLPEPFFSVDPAPREQMGLLGLTLDPAFSSNHHVYLFYSQAKDGKPWRNRVVRVTDVDGKGVDLQVVLDDLPIGTQADRGSHNGGRLGFGADGKLYVTIGDGGNRGAAQQTDKLAGKLLRANPDGSAPADNPFPGFLTYAYGLRNPWGLTFHPLTGTPYVTDNGPEAHDEVNEVEPGGNLGWPSAVGTVKGQRFIDPIWETRGERGAVTGMTFYSGDLFPEYKHDLLFCSFLQGHLTRLRLAERKSRVESQELLSDQCHLDVAGGPDGAIYISSINKVQRLVPAI
jgi:aldose sugar dehydrogenase